MLLNLTVRNLHLHRVQNLHFALSIFNSSFCLLSLLSRNTRILNVFVTGMKLPYLEKITGPCRTEKNVDL